MAVQSATENVYRTELSPVNFLRRSAYVYPARTAVVHGERRYTYREFDERVNRLSTALRSAGLEKGDRVAFICTNTPQLLEAHYGVPAAGGSSWRSTTASTATTSATSSTTPERGSCSSTANSSRSWTPPS